MTYRTIQTESEEGVARVWMHRPEVHNAFDEAMVAELTEVFAGLSADAGVRVVVLGGRGKHFCAGADLAMMQRAADNSEETNQRDARALAGMLRAIDGCSKPVIARVQGAALGGGTGLVAACDIAVAGDTAVFGTTEVRLGLAPSTISPYVVAAIGTRAARRYFLTGEKIGAEAALQIGLLHEVCLPEALDEAVGRILTAVLSGGPAAQAAVKRLIRDVAGREITDDLADSTARHIAALRTTLEAREGISAFLQKRKPSWNPPECR